MSTTIASAPVRQSMSFLDRWLPAWIGLGYTVLVGTVLGSGVWVWLMSRHPAGRVAPFSMLVPVSGLTTAWLVLGETLAYLLIALLQAALIVVVGIVSQR